MSNVNTINTNYDDFALKLTQRSAVETLREYILWQRKVRANDGKIDLRNNNSFIEGPVSINLDITVACNFSCDHCVDKKILNNGGKFSFNEICNTLKVLSSNGLKSVILIGGGEPLLHPQFEDVVRYIKSLGLELGICTNGSNITKLIKIADSLCEKDWIRFSLDAGTDNTFMVIHKPRKTLSLKKICSGVKRIKEINDKISIGFSYIIFWEDCKVDGVRLTENINEISAAADLASQNDFDYITFKPCLIKADSTSDRETLFYRQGNGGIKLIAQRIEHKLSEAKESSNGRIKINESINLRAMFGGELTRLKKQPKNCHSQIFRQIVTPIGIYHCPAYRGDQKAFIAHRDGYISQQKYEETISSDLELLLKFDASKECKDIVCFYNKLNWWIEDFINSGDDVYSLESIEDENSFL